MRCALTFTLFLASLALMSCSPASNALSSESHAGDPSVSVTGDADNGSSLSDFPTAPPACDYKSFIGQSVDRFDKSYFTQRKLVLRIVEPHQPVTMDYRFDRVNIIYDGKTRLILDVTCG
jgi:hypothetical protein